MTSRTSLHLWLALLAGFSLSTLLLAHVKSAPGIDFLQFWVLGRSMPFDSYEQFRGQAAYRAAVAAELGSQANDPLVQQALAPREDLQMTATPLFYALFSVAVGDDYVFDLRVFQLLSFAAFFGGLAYLMWSWGHSWPVIGVALSMITVFCTPLHSDIRVSNTNQLYIGLVAAQIWISRRQSFAVRTAVAQAVAGLLLLLKPYLIGYFAILILLRVAHRRWRTLAYEFGGALAGLGIGVLLPLLAGAPLRLWSDFLGIHGSYIEYGVYDSLDTKGDMSSVEVITDTFGLTYFQFGTALVLLFAVLCLATLFLTCRRPRAAGDESEDGSLAILSSLALFVLVCPLVWVHYYLLSLPLAFLLLQLPELPGWLGRARTASAVTATALLLGAWLTGVYALFGKPEDTEAFMALLFQVGNLLLVIVSLVEIARRVRGRAAPIPAPIPTS